MCMSSVLVCFSICKINLRLDIAYSLSIMDGVVCGTTVGALS